MNKPTLLLTIVLVLISLNICAGASSTTIEMTNVESGDFISGSTNVDTSGLVSFNAWTNDSRTIGLYLYNQTGNMVASNVGIQPSIDYIAQNYGTYTVKAYRKGGTGTVSVSGNHQLSLMPKYNRIADISQGNAIWYDISVNQGGQVFVHAWTSGSDDQIGLYLYDQIGNMVASNIASQTSIDYIAPNDGIYTVKAHLRIIYRGGGYKGETLNVSVSTNYPFIDSLPSDPTAQMPIPSTSTTEVISTTTELDSGSILVTSFPSGAGIYVDESYEGETPKILTNLPQDSPTIILKLEGYKDWEQNIDVASEGSPYIPVALEPSTTQFLKSTPTNEERLEKYRQEISAYTKKVREDLVDEHFKDGNLNLENGNYKIAKDYFSMARTISEDLNDQHLIEKADMSLEVANTKIESKKSIELIYALVLALGATLIIGYAFGSTFEKKSKVHRYLIIAGVFVLMFFAFYYILGRFT